MNRYRLLVVMLLTAALVLPLGATAGAQDGRLNAGGVLDIAIYCANGGVEIWHIDNSGSGNQALVVGKDAIGTGAAQAQGGQAVTIASGPFGISLTALPGLRLRAAQTFEGRNYSFDFNADSCGTLTLPANVPEGNFAPGTVIDSSGQPAVQAPSASAGGGSAAPTGSVVYTVARGDSLYRISRNFGISVNELMATNGLNFGSVIYPGQQLTIPNQTFVDESAGGGSGESAGSTAPSGPTVDAFGNYLTDPSFESGYTNRGRPDLNVPGAWGFQVITQPSQFYWQNLVPAGFPRRDPPIRSGGLSQNFNKGYATFSVVMFQQVAVPNNARLRASVWGWYHTCDAGSQNCNNNSNPIVRVGIDPNGGTNAFGPSVVWGGAIAPQGGWGLAAAEARAQGGVVTMFIYATQETPRAINELYLDDAALVVAG